MKLAKSCVINAERKNWTKESGISGISYLNWYDQKKRPGKGGAKDA